MYGEPYVFGVANASEAAEVEEGEVTEGWDADMENAEVGKLLPVESALIRRLRTIKFKIVVRAALLELPYPFVCSVLSLSHTQALSLSISTCIQ